MAFAVTRIWVEGDVWEWFTRFFGPDPGSPDGPPAVTLRDLEQRLEHTRVAIQCAYSFGWQVQDWRYSLAEHCARVSILTDWLGERLGLDARDRATVRHAAQLHEVGMIAIPEALVDAPRPLTGVELDRVRAHAAIGAGIIRLSYEPIKADLVEHQYATYADLRRQFPDAFRLRRLAGVFRVADVFDTLTHPRPYRRDIAASSWRDVLSAGTGTMFDPDAARILLRLSHTSGN